jgi:PleD family two-component response regulator
LKHPLIRRENGRTDPIAGRKMRYRAGIEIPLTVSIGIVECQLQDDSLTAVLTRVDSALYEAKRTGRNRAYCAHKEAAGTEG